MFGSICMSIRPSPRLSVSLLLISSVLLSTESQRGNLFGSVRLSIPFVRLFTLSCLFNLT